MQFYDSIKRKLYPINDKNYIIYAQHKPSGFQLRGIHKETPKTPEAMKIKIIPEGIIEALMQQDLHCTAYIATHASKETNSTYQQIVHLPETNLQDHLTSASAKPALTLPRIPRSAPTPTKDHPSSKKAETLNTTSPQANVVQTHQKPATNPPAQATINSGNIEAGNQVELLDNLTDYLVWFALMALPMGLAYLYVRSMHDTITLQDTQHIQNTFEALMTHNTFETTSTAAFSIMNDNTTEIPYQIPYP